MESFDNIYESYKEISKEVVMKKYLILPLILWIFLMGCSQGTKSNSSEDTEAVDKKEIFSKLLREKDLMSYVVRLKTKRHLMLNLKRKEK